MKIDERKRDEEKKLETRELVVACAGVRKRRPEEEDDLTNEEMSDLGGG
jgi:hypothetical protein